jgi:hypothetical protein
LKGGKSHLATGLAIAACRQRKRVRFTAAAALVNQLVEAQREHSLSRMLARWSRVELNVIDELGYVPLPEFSRDNRATGEAPRRAHPFGAAGRPCHGEKDKGKEPLRPS